MTCYMACVKPVTVQVEWGLHLLGGKPRKIKMNKAFMCNDCYSSLKGVVMKDIEAGSMHWQVEKVVQKVPVT